MSLIQEALRRQQEDSGDIPSEAAPPPVQQPATPPPPPTPPPADPGPPPLPTAAAAPPPPPPPPPPGPVEQPAPPTVDGPADLADAPPAATGAKPLPTLAGIAALVLILIGGGVWMLVYAFQQWQAPGEAETDETTPPETDTPPAVVEPEPDTGGDGMDPIPEQDTGNGSGEVTTTVPEISADDPPPDPLNAAPLPVEWPLLQLTAVVGSGRNGSVMINNEILGVGQEIEGAKIVAIGKQGAWLEYEGEKRFLSIEFVSQ